MALDKYIDTMSDVNYVYRYTVIELVRRGFKLSDARKMIRTSSILERIQGEDGWVFFHGWDEKEWANWVIDYHAKGGRLRYAG